MTGLDPFYPIFESADWLRRLLPLGIKLVQLRIKDRSEAETRAEIRSARDLCAAAGCQLIVNDYWRLAFEADPMEPRDMAAPSTPVLGKAFLG